MTKPLTSLFAIATFIVAASASAFAADMAVKAPPPPPAPVYSWTGWYVGGNFGAAWGTANNNMSFTQTDPGNPTATFNAQDSARFNGPIGGVQAGYNWQVSNFLLGVETDIQASPQTGTNTALNGTIFSLAPPNPATATDNEKLDWFGTLRGRLGLTYDRWLVYGTGGLAYGEVELNGDVQPATPQSRGSNAPIVWDHSTVQTGWVGGGGIENQMDPHWSWKVEYLFMDLGSASAPLSGGIGTLPNPSKSAGNCYGILTDCSFYRNPASGTITSHFTDNIVRVGLNYQFH